MYPEKIRNILRTKITNVLTNFTLRPVHNNYLRTLFFKTKKFLKTHPELIVTKAVKGNVSYFKKRRLHNKISGNFI